MRMLLASTVTIHFLYIHYNGFHRSISTIRIVLLLEIAAKDESYCLPEACSKAAFVLINYLIAVVSGFAID